jgi:hypothetical protein
MLCAASSSVSCGVMVCRSFGTALVALAIVHLPQNSNIARNYLPRKLKRELAAFGLRLFSLTA